MDSCRVDLGDGSSGADARTGFITRGDSFWSGRSVGSWIGIVCSAVSLGHFVASALALKLCISASRASWVRTMMPAELGLDRASLPRLSRPTVDCAAMNASDSELLCPGRLFVALR